MVTYVLGAPDPEMAAIERLLRGAGCTIAYAMCDGRRVTPGQASAPETVEPWSDSDGLPPDVVLVECALPARCRARIVARCDHHAPGDPGFGRVPAEFMQASSLGQVIAHLADGGLLPGLTGGQSAGAAGGSYYLTDGAWVYDFPASDGEPLIYQVPIDMVLAAAADHCLGAAYRGECPGVDPDALMRWRAASRAEFQHRPVAEVLADVEATSAALTQAPVLILVPGIVVCDMRRDPPWPELPEAATRLGAGYVSGPLRGSDGRLKYTASGSPQQIDAAMAWMAAQGFVGIYGDAARGFCGAYAR